MIWYWAPVGEHNQPRYLRSRAIEQRALEFATAAHATQVRKYTNEPYITHPVAVAELVRSVPHTATMIQAALLHDTVEDTLATSADIEAEFGHEVAELVAWLTDVSRPEDGNRAARKTLDREHTAKAPPTAKTIKLADLIDNSRSIVALDPKFAVVYLEEKRLLLPFLKEGDPTLWAMANEIAWYGGL